MPQNNPEPNKDDSRLTDREKYNVISDTVTGVNVRWKDNLFQAVFILVTVVLCAGAGALLVTDNRLAGALGGALGGLILGLFLSGLILMIYRAVQHARGKHE